MGGIEAERCAGCGAPMAGHYRELDLTCTSGHRQVHAFPVAVRARAPELGLAALVRRSAWRAAWAERKSGGPRIVEVCTRCSAPVVAAGDQRLLRGCSACDRHVEVTVGEALVDVLPRVEVPKPDWELRGGLTFEPFVRRPSLEGTLTCPSCGAEVDLEGEGTCGRCSARLVVLDAGGRRFLPGMRVRGHHRGCDVDGWMPVAEALAYLEGYRALGWSSMGATASGFLIVFLAMGGLLIGGPTVLLGAACLVPVVGDEGALALSLTGFAGLALMLAATAVAMVGLPMFLHRRARARHGVDHPPEVFPC